MHADRPSEIILPCELLARGSHARVSLYKAWGPLDASPYWIETNEKTLIKNCRILNWWFWITELVILIDLLVLLVYSISVLIFDHNCTMVFPTSGLDRTFGIVKESILDTGY